MKRYWWIPAALSVIAGTILIAVTLGKKIPGVPRVRTGEEKSELIPPEQCETLMRDWKFDADEIFHD